MPRGSGRQIRRKPLGDVLPLKPPVEMKGKGVRRCYQQLAGDLHAAGLARAADRHTVILAASAMARLADLRAELAAAGSLVVLGSTGQPRAHPLVHEVRSEESCLRQLLSALLLTPKSRATSRTAAEIARIQAGGKNEDDDDLLKLLA